MKRPAFDGQHVVMFSGGIGSWGAAKRVADRYGTNALTPLFADTKIEDADTYRFLREAAANVGGTLVEISEGRTPWQVFHDVRFLGNHRVDPCSRILKREVCDRWLTRHCQPETTVVYVGIDFTEEHRYTRLAERRKPWRYEAPLCEPPYLLKTDLHAWAEREGLRKQYLYRIGAAHANCGGGCVKMGQGGFALLLAAAPRRFAEWEHNEAILIAELGPAATILTDRRGGLRKPMPLSEFRKRIEANKPYDLFDIGGCGCFTDIEASLHPFSDDGRGDCAECGDGIAAHIAGEVER